MSIKSLLFSLISENDGKSLCPIRLFAAAVSVPAVIFFTIAFVLQLIHGNIEVQSMATTFATLTAGYAALGASVALKMKGETP